MFAKAYSLASAFTKPVIISVRFYDGTVECNGGAFVIVNEEGWIITAAHLLQPLVMSKQHQKELSAFKSQLEAVEKDSTLNARQKHKKLHQIQVNKRWITNHSFWWGNDGVHVDSFKVFPEADIAVGQLQPFDKTVVSKYPVFKDPSKGMNPGTSLCKLGYPFHKLEASFDETKNAFKLAPGVLPLPRFPIEGIYTRNIVIGKTQDGKHEIKLLETSSPGLRGQSGGPVFDTEGTVWAIQSRTGHFPLGFSPKIKRNGKELEENQFLNVGQGVHPDVIVSFLRDNGISFKLSEY